MKIFEKIKSRLKLAKSKVKGKRYVALQKPVNDMTYKEANKEFSKKEKIIFAQENNFIGRNKELVKKVIFESKNNDLAINYFIDMINNSETPKGVKYEFIHTFFDFYDDNELSKILSMKDDVVNNQYKVQIVRKCIDRVSEDLLLKYYDYTNIKTEYIRKILSKISVDSKIIILNRLKNKKLKEKLLIEEIEKSNFNDARKLLEQVILYGYKEIEDFYIKKIKNADTETALELINEFDFISPELAIELDKIIEPKDVDDVINYINENSVKQGGIIYLSRKFSLNNKLKIFYGLNKDEDRKNALVLFTEEFDKDKFIDIVKKENSEEVKVELINNMDKLLKEKNKFFNEIDIKELSSLCTINA